MSALSQFFGSRPVKTTTYTSGSGTFTPLVSDSWCRVTLVGGGGGGSAHGGAGSGTSVLWVRLSGPQSYAIGAGGVGGDAASSFGATGGTTNLGPLRQVGGNGSPWNFAGTGGSGSSGAGLGNAGENGLNGGGRGGNSMYGSGGASGGNSGTGYGSGGGGIGAGTGGNGTGGLIIIEEFGA